MHRIHVASTPPNSCGLGEQISELVLQDCHEQCELRKKYRVDHESQALWNQGGSRNNGPGNCGNKMADAIKTRLQQIEKGRRTVVATSWFVLILFCFQFAARFPVMFFFVCRCCFVLTLTFFCCFQFAARFSVMFFVCKWCFVLALTFFCFIFAIGTFIFDNFDLWITLFCHYTHACVTFKACQHFSESSFAVKD